MSAESTSDGGVGADLEPVTGFVFPARAHYNVTAGFSLSNALRALAAGRFVGQFSRESGRVYVPPLGACPIAGAPTDVEVELETVGTVMTFVIVNIPIHGQGIPLPFACANVLLDGADTPFLALIQECAIDEVRIGMRVEAVWAPEAERTTSLASVRYFRPNGEADRDEVTIRAEREAAWLKNREGGA